MYEEYFSIWDELVAPGADFAVDTIEVRGNPCRVYTTAPASLCDLWLSSSQFADREYLVYNEERLTYAEAHQQVANLARYLAAQGIGAGDYVAIAMRNYPEYMLAYWAILSTGSAVVGMNAWWTTPEMSYALNDSAPKAIFVDQERYDRIDPEERKNLQVIGVRFDSEQSDVQRWQDCVSGDAQPLALEIDPDSDACIFYTSGTTGRPKGAQLTHRGCVSNVWSMMFAGSVLRLLGIRNGVVDPDIAPPISAALVTTPLFHVTANNCVAQGTTLGGGKLVHMYKWDAGEALDLIESERITALTGVPVMAREVIAHPKFGATDTSSLQSLGGGGAQLPPDLVGKIDQSVATAKPSTGYGMTETCGIITSIGGDFFIDRPDSCGPAMPCYETKIVDAEGNEVANGGNGELLVRGAQVIRGYLNREDATAESIHEGWLRTGDVAREDADGFLYIVDRIKDMVLRGGENIYCAEVESALYEHLSVAECSVFGVPDDRLGEEVGVAIYFGDNQTISADDLRSHCRALIAAPKIPRYIWIQVDPLPRNASGKFLKRELRETLDTVRAI
ncbi:MAG: class I adenylate-forming enzyme family protein [Pseudomonadales bacterium]|nr:class I adenylate-forming enzyme family protein [Pseudomonadales bacterium]